MNYIATFLDESFNEFL